MSLALKVGVSSLCLPFCASTLGDVNGGATVVAEDAARVRLGLSIVRFFAAGRAGHFTPFRWFCKLRLMIFSRCVR
jgi:hypothetical protein